MLPHREQEHVLAEQRYEFYKSAGGFNREANQWTLITDTVSGARSVEHAWSCIDPFGHGERDEGASVATVENFLTGKAHDSVKQKLRELLPYKPGANEKKTAMSIAPQPKL